MRIAIIVVALAALAAESSSEPKKSVWQPLAKKGAKWTLPLSKRDYEGSPGKVAVTITDVRKVGKADVVRVEYACMPAGDCSNGELPAQIAITDQGAYFFRDDDDAAIAKALKGHPMLGDPPKPTKPTKKNGGLLVLTPKQRKGTYCVGTVDVEGCGAAPCAAWMCVDDSGIVGVGDLGSNGLTFGFTPGDIPR